MSFPDQDEPSDSRRRRGRRRDTNDFDDFWGRDNGGTPGRGRKRGGEDADDLSDLADGGRGAPPVRPGRRDGGARPTPSPPSLSGSGAGAAAGPRPRPDERPPLTARRGPAPAPRPERPPVAPSPTRRPVGAPAAVPPHQRTGELGVPGGSGARPTRGRSDAGVPATEAGRAAGLYDDPRAGVPPPGSRTRGGPERPVGAGRGGALPPDPQVPGDRTAVHGGLPGAARPAGRNLRGPSAPGRGVPAGPEYRTDPPLTSRGPAGPGYGGGRPPQPGGRSAPGYRAASGGPADPEYTGGQRRPAGPGGGRGDRGSGVDRPTEAVDMTGLVFSRSDDVPPFPGVADSPTYAASGPRLPWDDDLAEDDDYDEDTYYDDYDELDDADAEDLPKRRGCRNALIVLAILVVVAMVASWLAWSWVQGKIDPAGGPGEEVLVEIPEGTSTAGIGEVLAEAGVITDAGIWNWYTKLNDPGTIQAGSYIMRVDSSFDQAIDALANEPLPPNSTLVTVPPGLTQAQIATRLADPENGVAGFTVDKVNAALADPAARSPIIPAGQPLVEGTLFPETYTVEEGDTEAVVIRRMVDQFETVATELQLNERAAALGLTPYEVLIVASMVEREAGPASDGPKVARVIYNRLAADEALGIDATSCYPTGEFPCNVDEAIGLDSSYNTRDKVGLPPTPIASPGQASIEAALAPAEGDWHWYILDVTKDDGSSLFTNDYEGEFLPAKERCQEAGQC